MDGKMGISAMKKIAGKGVESMTDAELQLLIGWSGEDSIRWYLSRDLKDLGERT